MSSSSCQMCLESMTTMTPPAEEPSVDSRQQEEEEEEHRSQHRRGRRRRQPRQTRLLKTKAEPVTQQRRQKGQQCLKMNKKWKLNRANRC